MFSKERIVYILDVLRDFKDRAYICGFFKINLFIISFQYLIRESSRSFYESLKLAMKILRMLVLIYSLIQIPFTVGNLEGALVENISRRKKNAFGSFDKN